MYSLLHYAGRVTSSATGSKQVLKVKVIMFAMHFNLDQMCENSDLWPYFLIMCVI